MQYTYDFNKVVLIVGPVYVSGFAEGSSITVEAETAGVEFDRGTDGGTAMIVHSFDPTLTLKFKLMQGSPANKALTALYATRVAPGFIGYPTSLTNILGGENALIPQSALTHLPQITYDEKNNEREWIVMGVGPINAFGAFATP